MMRVSASLFGVVFVSLETKHRQTEVVHVVHADVPCDDVQRFNLSSRCRLLVLGLTVMALDQT